MLKQVAALFVRADSVYKTMPSVDAWDESRDARNWPGGCPVVAHPPCRLWGRLRQFAKASDPLMERQLGIDAVRHVQQWGGVLEHPSESTLWAHMGLPAPGRAPDDFGGWTAEIRQCDWGHKAEKPTWLYIVGCHPDDIPALPPRGEPTGYIRTQLPMSERVGAVVTKAEREHTPPALAAWLVDLARRCAVARPTPRASRPGALPAERSPRSPRTCPPPLTVYTRCVEGAPAQASLHAIDGPTSAERPICRDLPQRGDCISHWHEVGQRVDVRPTGLALGDKYNLNSPGFGASADAGHASCGAGGFGGVDEFKKHDGLRLVCEARIAHHALLRKGVKC